MLWFSNPVLINVSFPSFLSLNYVKLPEFSYFSSSCSLKAEFPANTNILYVDLHSAELVGSFNNEKCLPGMVINGKKPIVYVDYFGNRHRYSLCLITLA